MWQSCPNDPVLIYCIYSAKNVPQSAYIELYSERGSKPGSSLVYYGLAHEPVARDWPDEYPYAGSSNFPTVSEPKM